jgi:hypothetical protein
VATIATLSFTMAAIARGMRRSMGVVGVERLRGRHGCVRLEREFLQDQVIPNHVEGWERHTTHDDGSKMIVPLVQPLKNIEDKVAIRGGAVEVT